MSWIRLRYRAHSTSATHSLSRISRPRLEVSQLSPPTYSSALQRTVRCVPVRMKTFNEADIGHSVSASNNLLGILMVGFTDPSANLGH